MFEIKTASIPQLKYLSFFPSRIFARPRSPAFRITHIDSQFLIIG